MLTGDGRRRLMTALGHIFRRRHVYEVLSTQTDIPNCEKDTGEMR